MSKASSRFFFAMTTLFVIFFVWMWFAKVDITTQAVGIVVPEKNITKLGTMVTGEIVAVNYKQGDVVKKGDVIITINPGVGYEPRNIVANIDGRIQELTYRNPGSVVKQGDGLAILVPLDQKLIDFTLMEETEINWLERYHSRVRRVLMPLVDTETRSWLHRATASPRSYR